MLLAKWSLCAILASVGAVSAFAQDADSLLAQLEQRRGQRPTVGEVDAVSRSLMAGPILAGDPSSSYGFRLRRAARTLAVLNVYRGLAASDPALQFALASAYSSVGSLQLAGGDPRFIDSRGALLSYQNAFLVLSQLANQNPNDPRVRGELIGIGARIRALGGTLPVWFSVPVGGNRESAPSGISEPALRAAKQAPVQFDAPTLDTSKVAEGLRFTCEDAIDRYLVVASSAQGALSVLDSLRVSLAARGLTPRGDYVAAESRLLERMKSALAQLNSGSCAEAADSIRVAEAVAQKLSKELGN